MPRSIRSSSTSAPCRLDWRPSRWLALALRLLGVLGALSALASEAPRALAWPIALLATVEGMRLARGTLRLAPRTLVWPFDGMPALDGIALRDPVLHWRGPLAFLRWRDADGRTQRLAWWPDVLPVAARRELRLAAMESSGAAPVASMAP